MTCAIETDSIRLYVMMAIYTNFGFSFPDLRDGDGFNPSLREVRYLFPDRRGRDGLNSSPAMRAIYMNSGFSFHYLRD